MPEIEDKRAERRAFMDDMISEARREGMPTAGDPFAEMYDEETGLPK
jgi:hypothetical protein